MFDAYCPKIQAGCIRHQDSSLGVRAFLVSFPFERSTAGLLERLHRSERQSSKRGKRPFLVINDLVGASLCSTDLLSNRVAFMYPCSPPNKDVMAYKGVALHQALFATSNTMDPFGATINLQALTPSLSRITSLVQRLVDRWPYAKHLSTPLNESSSELLPSRTASLYLVCF